MLQFMGTQRVGHDRVTELKATVVKKTNKMLTFSKNIKKHS